MQKENVEIAAPRAWEQGQQLKGNTGTQEVEFVFQQVKTEASSISRYISRNEESGELAGMKF